MVLKPLPYTVAVVINGDRTDKREVLLEVADNSTAMDPYFFLPNSKFIDIGSSGEAGVQHNSTLWITKLQPIASGGFLSITPIGWDTFYFSSVIFYSYLP